jgi:ABC-2 type transport system permease protein
VSRPAPAVRSVSALIAHDLRLTTRRGENVLVTIVIPIAVLLFFASTGIIPGIGGRPVDFLVPGSIALAIVASGLVNLGIATAYERSYGVLKRLGGAPIPRWGLVVSKIGAVLVLEVVQVVALVAVAVLVLGWAPGAGWSPVLLLVAILLGTTTFASLGLLLAGTLRAEATLALANGLFLGFLMLGGIVLPVDHLPDLLRPIASVLPATALADLLRISLASGATTALAAGPLATLTTWGVAATALAIRAFRWD